MYIIFFSLVVYIWYLGYSSILLTDLSPPYLPCSTLPLTISARCIVFISRGKSTSNNRQSRSRTNWGFLYALQISSGPLVHGRTETDGKALLHQQLVTQLPAGRRWSGHFRHCLQLALLPGHSGRMRADPLRRRLDFVVRQESERLVRSHYYYYIIILYIS